MATPADKTIHNLNGKWLMNKKLTDPIDPILSLQGIGWITRKAINMATVTLSHKQYTQDGVMHLDIDQTATGGVKGTSEQRVLDWETHVHTDWLFGEVNAKCRMTTIAAVKELASDPNFVHAKDIAFVTEGWLPESVEGQIMENIAVNEKSKWSGYQIWGFAEIEHNGVKGRWYVRKVAIRRLDKDEVVYATMVYEWVGEN